VLRSRFNPFGESLNRFDHILNDLLRITKDHHGFIHVEQNQRLREQNKRTKLQLLKEKTSII
jgi:hypothetical protein